MCVSAFFWFCILLLGSRSTLTYIEAQSRRVKTAVHCLSGLCRWLPLPGAGLAAPRPSLCHSVCFVVDVASLLRVRLRVVPAALCALAAVGSALLLPLSALVALKHMHSSLIRLTAGALLLCKKALYVPLVHSLINHFRQKLHRK